MAASRRPALPRLWARRTSAWCSRPRTRALPHSQHCKGDAVEQIAIGKSALTTSRIGLGTWAIGGWMWGGSDEAQSIATIRSAVQRGVTLIDTAPAYGFGRSEEIIGKALAESALRDRV